VRLMGYLPQSTSGRTPEIATLPLRSEGCIIHYFRP
jgi:hypothetical protein